jgi:hypothetical protein
MTPNRRALMKLTKAKLVEMVIEAEQRAMGFVNQNTVLRDALLEAEQSLADEVHEHAVSWLLRCVSLGLTPFALAVGMAIGRWLR